MSEVTVVFQASTFFSVERALLDLSFLDRLKNTLEIYKYDYGGRVVKVCDHYTDYWKVRNVLPKNLFLKKATYCCGRFYFLSKIGCDDLVNKKAIFVLN